MNTWTKMSHSVSFLRAVFLQLKCHGGSDEVLILIEGEQESERLSENESRQERKKKKWKRKWNEKKKRMKSGKDKNLYETTEVCLCVCVCVCFNRCRVLPSKCYELGDIWWKFNYAIKKQNNTINLCNGVLFHYVPADTLVIQPLSHFQVIMGTCAAGRLILFMLLCFTVNIDTWSTKPELKQPTFKIYMYMYVTWW